MRVHHFSEVEGPLNCSFFTNLCDAFGWKLLLLVGLAEITLKETQRKSGKDGGERCELKQ